MVSATVETVTRDSDTRILVKNKFNRCLSKKGEVKIRNQNVENVPGRLLEDFFSSALELSWHWILLLFSFIYFGSWLLFALFWYSLLYLHGDLLDYPAAYPSPPCITNITSFGAAFLFSVETQHTTGYGFYQINDECPQAIILMCIQSIVGIILEGICVGLVFLKFTRAKNRRATLIFSKQGVVTRRDGHLCLMFRIGDVRCKSHLLHPHVRARLIRKRETLEGEIIQYHQEDLSINEQFVKSGKVFLFWPQVIVHILDESSPLKNLQAKDLTPENDDTFEIILVLEGIVQATGHAVQTRSSYLPSEILWGHRFKDVHLPQKGFSGQRIVDYSLFHETYPVEDSCIVGN